MCRSQIRQEKYSTEHRECESNLMPFCRCIRVSHWVHRFLVFSSRVLKYFRFCCRKCLLFGRIPTLFGQRCHSLLSRRMNVCFLGRKVEVKKRNPIAKQSEDARSWLHLPLLNYNFSFASWWKLLAQLCLGIAPAAPMFTINMIWLAMLHTISSI